MPWLLCDVFFGNDSICLVTNFCNLKIDPILVVFDTPVHISPLLAVISGDEINIIGYWLMSLWLMIICKHVWCEQVMRFVMKTINSSDGHVGLSVPCQSIMNHRDILPYMRVIYHEHDPLTDKLAEGSNYNSFGCV